MASRRRPSRFHKPSRTRRPGSKEVLLESGTLESLRFALQRSDLLRQFDAAVYAALESQRAAVREEVARALISAARPMQFSGWQRVVPMKHSDQPLSSRGSVISAIGGRFNVGAFDPDQFEPFPALYLATDKETALEETLGDPLLGSNMSALELALQRPDSIAIFAIGGEVAQVLDVANSQQLQPFVDQIKNFKLPDDLRAWARKLKVDPARLSSVSSVTSLVANLLKPDWRLFPNMLGIPSNPQVFGRLARSAGIQAIRYASTKSGKPCLAIFPHNLDGTDAYVELEGELSPQQHSVIRRLDATTWRTLI
jgi:hypothetical protein